MQRAKTLTHNFQVAERKRVQDERAAEQEAKLTLQDASRDKIISLNCDCIKAVCEAFKKRTQTPLTSIADAALEDFAQRNVTATLLTAFLHI